MNSSTTIERSKLLLVEGKDEENFFKKLLKKLSINDVQIIGVGGVEHFKVDLPSLVRMRGFNTVTSIGIVQDADTNCINRFTSIKATLSTNNLPAPNNLISFTSTNPRVGVFIMPNNYSKGMLETLCLSSLVSDIKYDCVNNLFECLDKNGVAIRNIDKAKCLAYLSTQDRIVNSLGLAAQKEYWDFDSPVFTPIKDFLNTI